MIPEFTVLALDPSTDITGAVVVSYGESREILHAKAWDARHAEELGTLARRDDLQSAIARIRWTRGKLSRFVADVDSFDTFAFEGHTGRGSGSATLDMAFGAYLTLSCFSAYNPVLVTRQAACKATKTDGVYRQSAGKTTAEIAAKKARLKGAVVAWAMSAFPELSVMTATMPLPEIEAIADALAVAEAAYVFHTAACAAAEAKVAAKAQTRLALRAPKGDKA